MDSIIQTVAKVPVSLKFSSSTMSKTSLFFQVNISQLINSYVVSSVLCFHIFYRWSAIIALELVPSLAKIPILFILNNLFSRIYEYQSDVIVSQIQN